MRQSFWGTMDDVQFRTVICFKTHRMYVSTSRFFFDSQKPNCKCFTSSKCKLYLRYYDLFVYFFLRVFQEFHCERDQHHKVHPDRAKSVRDSHLQLPLQVRLKAQQGRRGILQQHQVEKTHGTYVRTKNIHVFVSSSKICALLGIF